MSLAASTSPGYSLSVRRTAPTPTTSGHVYSEAHTAVKLPMTRQGITSLHTAGGEASRSNASSKVLALSVLPTTVAVLPEQRCGGNSHSLSAIAAAPTMYSLVHKTSAVQISKGSSVRCKSVMGDLTPSTQYFNISSRGCSHDCLDKYEGSGSTSGTPRFPSRQSRQQSRQSNLQEDGDCHSERTYYSEHPSDSQMIPPTAVYINATQSGWARAPPHCQHNSQDEGDCDAELPSDSQAIPPTTGYIDATQSGWARTPPHCQHNSHEEEDCYAELPSHSQTFPPTALYINSTRPALVGAPIVATLSTPTAFTTLNAGLTNRSMPGLDVYSRVFPTSSSVVSPQVVKQRKQLQGNTTQPQRAAKHEETCSLAQDAKQDTKAQPQQAAKQRETSRRARDANRDAKKSFICGKLCPTLVCPL